MSPFREQPSVELGPLEVGLEAAAARAVLAVPRGGRILAASSQRFAPHAAGALGSAGLLAALILAFTAATSSWRPQTMSDVVSCMTVVILSGLSLALVLRATDRSVAHPTRRGEVIGRAARRVVVRMARLAGLAKRSPEDFGAREIESLRRSLLAASAPELVRWIPRDVRGRAELLLARILAVHHGPHWASNAAVRAEVKDLLVVASYHLDQPSPAESDLRILEQGSGSRASRRLANGPECALEAEREALALIEASEIEEAREPAQSGAPLDRVLGAGSHPRPSRA